MSDAAVSETQKATQNQMPMQDLLPVNIPRISIQAFCLEAGTLETIERASVDRRMAKAHTTVHHGGIPAAVELFQTASTPNLLIVETLSTHQEILAELDALAEVCDAGTTVLVIGRVNDVELYRALIQRGVSEYVVGPIDLARYINTVGQFYQDTETALIGRTIAVIGAKGGCGASSVAHNISWSIAKQLEIDVAIADLDLAFGTAGLDFNKDPLQGIWEAVASPDRLDDNFMDRLLTKCNEHLSLLAAPATLDKAYDFGEDQFDSIIEIMQKGTPSVVLDLPHTWTSWVKHIIAIADEVVVVAEPDLANLRNAKNLIDGINNLRPNDKMPFLILNKVNVPKRPEIKPEEFSSALRVTNLASIPFDPALFGTASNNGQMIAEFDSRHAVAGQFKAIAARVMGKEEYAAKSKSLFGALLKKVRK